MPKLRNINPLGYVDVPILGREGPAPAYGFCEPCSNPNHAEHDPANHEHGDELIVKEPGSDQPGIGCLVPGEEFETTPEIAALLLEQDGNYELVKPRAAKKAAAPRKPRTAKKAAATPAPVVVEDTTEKGV